MATSKPKKRTDSFDRYARAIQDDIAALGKSMKEGFQSIREEMATKDDIRQVREQMVTKGEFKEVRDDVKRITDAMVSKADLEETIRDDFGPRCVLRDSVLRITLQPHPLSEISLHYE